MIDISINKQLHFLRLKEGTKMKETMRVAHKSSKGCATISGGDFPACSGEIIELTDEQFTEVASLFKGYAIPKPGWFRTIFKLTRNRKTALNRVFEEAGLDKDWCLWSSRGGDWAAEAHKVWHVVNGVTA
jgi:hypothetical protein